MDTPHGFITLPSRPGTSQGSNPNSRTRRSAARGQNLPKDKNLTVAQSHPESVQAHNGVCFQYSAGRSAASVSTSVADTAGQTARAIQVQGRSTASCLHYLEKKMRMISSKADSFREELERAISVLYFKIESFTHKIEREYISIRDTDISGEEFLKALDLFNAKKDSYNEKLKSRIDLLNDTKASYSRDISRQTRLLKSRLAPFADKLNPHMKLLNSKIDSNIRDLKGKLKILSRRYARYFRSYWREYTNYDII